MTKQALNVEYIAKKFYGSFKKERADFLEHVKGIAAPADRDWYGSLLLGRLIFSYFLQKRGYLDNDRHYLSNHLQTIRRSRRDDTYYRSFLLPLFYQGLGRPERSPELIAVLGHVPYLDGDLFTECDIERRYLNADLPDEAFAQLFAFFEAFEWQLDTPHDASAFIITPDVLGYIFEQHVNQQQMGAYYTKEDVTEYIASNTIIPALFDALARLFPTVWGMDGPIWRSLQVEPDRYIYQAIRSQDHLPGETEREFQARRSHYISLRSRLVAGQIQQIDDLITYNLNIRQFAEDLLSRYAQEEVLIACYQHLRQMSILDPTCGSGAFLFAALNTLEPLYIACLERTNPGQLSRYFILKTIITHNLYGVDIMEEAVEICKLRLFLKLIAQVQCIEDIEPLPHMGRHICTGNALVGFTSLPHLPANETLDQAQARLYGIVDSQARAFEEWRTSHRPFHWGDRFAEIFQRGGFSVIIGNPPYVEYSDSRFPYTVLNFETRSCTNLYAYVIERSRQLLSPYGRQGMILPLAAFATRHMTPLIEGFQRWFPCSWISFYHFRPAMLFSGGKVASIPTAIYLARPDGPERRFSTHLIKWSTAHRHLLFSRLTYCQITAPTDPENRHYYPKIGHPLENSILEKILRHQKLSSYLSPTANQNTMFYRTAGGLYWKIFVNFAWPYITTSNKECSFQEDYERDIFVALLNSTLFWWYYTLTFDTFNLKDYMIFGFRFNYPEEQETIDALRLLCKQLMNDFQFHARHLKRLQTGSYTIYARKSKAIIDEIDYILARHYGFTSEELDLIIHYDSQYRTSDIGPLEAV